MPPKAVTQHKITPQAMASINSLPSEILFEIASYCTRSKIPNRDLISLVQTSRHVGAAAEVLLYRDVEFVTLTTFLKFVITILRRPHLRNSVRRMTLYLGFLADSLKKPSRRICVPREQHIQHLFHDFAQALKPLSHDKRLTVLESLHVREYTLHGTKVLDKDDLLRQIIAILPIAVPSLQELNLTGTARQSTLAGFSTPNWNSTSLPRLQKISTCFMDSQNLVRPFPPPVAAVSLAASLLFQQLATSHVTLTGLYISPNDSLKILKMSDQLSLHSLIIDKSTLPLDFLRHLLVQLPELRTLRIRECKLYDDAPEAEVAATLVEKLEVVHSTLEELHLEQIKFGTTINTGRCWAPGPALPTVSFKQFTNLKKLAVNIHDRNTIDRFKAAGQPRSPSSILEWSEVLPTGLRTLIIVDENEFRLFCAPSTSMEEICGHLESLAADRLDKGSLADLRRIEVRLSDKRRLGPDWDESHLLMATTRETFKQQGVDMDFIMRQWLTPKAEHKLL